MASAALRDVLVCAMGFVLGSVLPADLLARVRGVDIRAVGDGNPGTVNAFRELGWSSGLLVAGYDISVGVVTIGIARLVGVSEGVAYLAGIMTIAGHRFPVLRGFKGGGQGMGASAGMLVYAVAVAVSRGWLSPLDLGMLVAVMLATFALTRSDVYVSVVILPVLAARLLLGQASWQFDAFVVVVAGHIWLVQLAVLLRRHRTPASRQASARSLRRPFSGARRGG